MMRHAASSRPQRLRVVPVPDPGLRVRAPGASGPCAAAQRAGGDVRPVPSGAAVPDRRDGAEQRIPHVAFTGPAGAPFVIATGPFNPARPRCRPAAPGSRDAAVFSDLSCSSTARSRAPRRTSSALPGTRCSRSRCLRTRRSRCRRSRRSSLDPLRPYGFAVTAASAITLRPSRSILFLQGDYDPGFGIGPTCRLADTSSGRLLQLARHSAHRGVQAGDRSRRSHGRSDAAAPEPTRSRRPRHEREDVHRRGRDRDRELRPRRRRARRVCGLMFGPGSARERQPDPGAIRTARQPRTTSAARSSRRRSRPHPISAGLFGVGGEGRQHHRDRGQRDRHVHERRACVRTAAPACRIRRGAERLATPTYSAIAAVTAGLGRVVATFDRNTFFNYPGYGSNIMELEPALRDELVPVGRRLLIAGSLRSSCDERSAGVLAGQTGRR